MRVLFIIDSLVPGGAEQSTVAVLPFLVQRGIRPEIAMLHDRPGLQDVVASHAVPLHDLSGPGGRVGWIRRTKALLDAQAFDVVHTTLFEADIVGRTAARLAGVPVVSTLATARYGPDHLDDPNLRRWKVRAGQALDMATARSTRRLHAVSEHVAEATSERLRYSQDRIDVVPRGRSVKLASPRSHDERANTRRELALGDRPTVIVVARQDRVKGIDRVLAAMPKVVQMLDDVVLIVAGRPGNQTTELSAIVEELGLQDSVRFLGARDDVGALLHASDVFVLGSRREGHPGSLLEAMAVGVPTVVHDMAQTREVVDERHSVLVDVADADAMGSAIAAVLADGRAAKERAERSRQLFLDRYTLDRVADEMVAFYARVTEGGRVACS